MTKFNWKDTYDFTRGGLLPMAETDFAVKAEHDIMSEHVLGNRDLNKVLDACEARKCSLEETYTQLYAVFILQDRGKVIPKVQKLREQNKQKNLDMEMPVELLEQINARPEVKEWIKEHNTYVKRAVRLHKNAHPMQYLDRVMDEYLVMKGLEGGKSLGEVRVMYE